MRVRRPSDSFSTGKHFDNGMRGCVVFARSWWPLDQEVAAINSLGRVDGSGYIVRVITGCHETAEAWVVPAKDPGDCGVSVFLAVEHCTDISGDGIAENLRADWTSWDE